MTSCRLAAMTESAIDAAEDSAIIDRLDAEILRIRFGFRTGTIGTLDAVAAMFETDRFSIRQREMRAMHNMRAAHILCEECAD